MKSLLVVLAYFLIGAATALIFMWLGYALSVLCR